MNRFRISGPVFLLSAPCNGKPAVRLVFFLSSLCTFIAFGIFGLYASMVPVFLRDMLPLLLMGWMADPWCMDCALTAFC